MYPYLGRAKALDEKTETRRIASRLRTKRALQREGSLVLLRELCGVYRPGQHRRIRAGHDALGLVGAGSKEVLETRTGMREPLSAGSGDAMRGLIMRGT